MKNINKRKLIKRTSWFLISVVIWAALFSGINFAISFAELKFGTAQLNGGDEGYLIVQGLSAARTFINVICAIVLSAIVALDIYDFYKDIAKEAEGENK